MYKFFKYSQYQLCGQLNGPEKSDYLSEKTIYIWCSITLLNSPGNSERSLSQRVTI